MMAIRLLKRAQSIEIDVLWHSIKISITNNYERDMEKSHIYAKGPFSNAVQ